MSSIAKLKEIAQAEFSNTTAGEVEEPTESTKQAKRRGPGRPFTKGDPRINRKGRPKTMDQLKSLAMAIAHEPAVSSGGTPIRIIDGYGREKHITVAEAILRQWATSKNPRLQENFIRIAFGPIPNIPEVVAFQQVALSWTAIASSIATAISRVVDDPVLVSLIASEIERSIATMHEKPELEHDASVETEPSE